MDSVTEKALKERIENERYVVVGRRKEGCIEVIVARYEPNKPPKCTQCGCERMWKHGKRRRRVSYGEFNGEPIDLDVGVERYRCPECKRTQTPELPDVKRRARLSDGLKKYIIKMLTELKCTAYGIAKMFRLGWTTVWRTVKNAFTDKAIETTGVRNLCIDEVYYKWPHRYLTVLTDADRGRICESSDINAVAGSKGTDRHALN